MNTLYIGILIALVMAGISVWLLRKLTRPEVSSEDLNAWIDLDWRSCSPLERLLDPSEFAFLQKRGVSQARIGELRARRRTLFRMYMRRLTREFNVAHDALKTALVTSEVDRPDLARELGRQRLLF